MAREKRKAVFSTLLFFVGGGFGFWYFFDLLKANPGNLSRLFAAFYETPTNFFKRPAWVNPIADMMIPQRALLFGWSILFACLFSALPRRNQKGRFAFLPLAILAGGTAADSYAFVSRARHRKRLLLIRSFALVRAKNSTQVI
jgi:hypothetical protein